jgi:hypothetical protein
MDTFLQESDPADVFLPLAGGTMSGTLNVSTIGNLLNTDLVIDAYNDDGAGTHNYFTFNPYGGGLEMPDNTAGIVFNNASRLREGLTDAGNGGASGIAMVCSLDYEFKWEAGRLYVMGQDGFTIRTEMFGFTAVPTTTDDDTKGYIVGSRRILDDGTVYVCTDATEDAAVWEYQGIRDIAGLDSINQDTRKLIASDGATEMLNWSSSANIAIPIGINLGVDLIFDAGSPSRYIDVVNGELGDYNTNYIPSIDWANRDLYHSDGSYSLSWQIRKLYDSAGVMALDWANRQLVGTDGSTVNLNWSDSSKLTVLGNYDLVRNSNAELELLDNVSSASVKLNSRQLIASDGTTIIADWGATSVLDAPNGFSAPAVNLVPTSFASLAGLGEGTIAYVNDADTPVIGSAVVGGASAKCLVCYNGTDWIVTALL